MIGFGIAINFYATSIELVRTISSANRIKCNTLYCCITFIFDSYSKATIHFGLRTNKSVFSATPTTLLATQSNHLLDCLLACDVRVCVCSCSGRVDKDMSNRTDKCSSNLCTRAHTHARCIDRHFDINLRLMMAISFREAKCKLVSLSSLCSSAGGGNGVGAAT